MHAATKKIIAYRNAEAATQVFGSSLTKKASHSVSRVTNSTSEVAAKESAKQEHSTPKGGQGLRKEQNPDSAKKSSDDMGTDGRLAVGTKVEMLFADGIWYQGTIERYNPRSGRYTIEFPDGDVQTARLPDKDVRILCASSFEPLGEVSKAIGNQGQQALKSGSAMTSLPGMKGH